MQMRASIARALVTRPALMLMDEPFAALDDFTRQRLDDELLALWRARGFAVVFVTHSVAEAVYLSTRVVVMSPRPGRIVDQIDVDAPSPRGDDFRTSTGFAALARRVTRAVAAAAGDAR
jgi:NitT/TauT family transport system ATP-binding protein